MKKTYFQQGAILAIFSLILLSQADSKVAENTERTASIRADRSPQISKNDAGSQKNVKKQAASKKNGIITIAYSSLTTANQCNSKNIVNALPVVQPVAAKKIKQLQFPSRVGLASWYGPGFNGRRMADGEIYNMNDISVAHRTLPFGTKIKITNLANGKSIVAPVLDRGPYVKNAKGQFTREVDLSSAAADILGTKHSGVVSVRIEPVDI